MDVRAQIDGVRVTSEDVRYYDLNYGIGMYILSTDEEGKEHEIQFSSSGTRNAGYVSLLIRGGNNAKFIAPKEFDNIKIYDNNQNLVITETFEKSPNSLANWKNLTDIATLAGNGDINKVWPSNTTAFNNLYDGAIVTEYDHLRVNANTDTAASVKYAPASGIVLTPGKYELTFDARQSYFFHDAANHGRNVALTLESDKAIALKLNGSDFNGKIAVTDAWDEYKLTFEVTETTTLSSLSFGGTGETNDKEAFDLSRISLKMVSTSASRPVYSTEDNFLDNAKETYNGAVYTEHDKNTENGFVTITQRNWALNGNYAQPAQDLIAVCPGGTYDPNYSYYMQFDARNHVPSDGRQNFSVRFCEVIGTKPDNKTQILSSSNKWQTFIFSHPINDSSCTGKTLRFRVERGTIWAQTSDPLTFWANIPVDFDNIIIWKEAAGGDGVYTDADKANVLYSETFNVKGAKYDKDVNASGGYWLTGGVIVVPALYSHNFENNFSRISVTDDNVTPVLSYTDLNNGEGHDEGVYSFSIQLRTHYNYENMRYNPNNIDTFNTSNNHKANITFTMTPADGGENLTVTRSVDVNYHWNSYESALIVEKGYKLTKIDVTPVYNTAFAIPAAVRGFDFANAKLNYAEYPVIETDDNKNYLDNTTVYVDNAFPKEAVPEDTNGYLYVSERTKDADIPFSMKIEGKIVAGTTYFIEYDIMCEGSGNMEIRPRLTARLAGNRAQADGYFEATSDSGLATYTASSDGKEEPSWYLSELESGVSYHFKGTFVPAGTYDSFEFQLRRGRNAKYTHALTFDNFRIYDENGVEVYTNDFQTEDAADLITKQDPTNDGYEIEHILPVNHTLYTPMDSSKPMSITYDIQLTDEEKVEGKYQFKALAKLAETSENPAKVCVKFNFSDGSEEVLCFDLSEKWTLIGNSGRLDRHPTLETVTVTFETDVPVMVNSSALYITYKYQYGKPNTGIVMMLIKKMQGKFVDPWRGLA